MFVVIAKNASTTLKRLVHSLDYPEAGAISDTEAIHEFFGYSYDNKVRIPLTASSKYCSSRYIKFAVYRDPVERFLSVYYDKVSPLRSSGKPVRNISLKAELLMQMLTHSLTLQRWNCKKRARCFRMSTCDDNRHFMSHPVLIL